MIAWMLIGLIAYAPIVLWRFSKTRKQSICWPDIIFALPFGPLALVVVISVALIAYPQCWGKR